MPYHGNYDTPAELLRDDKLSHHEKVEMLESWRDDKEALMRAAEEGMQGDIRSDLLSQIEKALTALEESPPDQQTK